LRAIREQLDGVRGDITELKNRMSGVEQHLLAFTIDITTLNQRQGCVEARLERIERRLGLIEV
jgi:hypothetical protein